MSRRVYTPPSRPNKGASIRVGSCEVVDHVDKPIGFGLLKKGSVDACGAISARRGSFLGVSQSARAALYGNDDKGKYE